jgi:DNA (cytosine-5)-methyltransferase 1
MSAYYNEIDSFAAQWLRELIKAGLIADGEVDERDIRDVRADDLRGFTQCHFFAGIGGWSYALRLAGWPDDRPVWTGSCPCQPFSAAGRGYGEQDARHLWPVWHPIIAQCRPSTIFGEQVAGKDGLAWIDSVSDDLEGNNYAFAAADLPAACVGAPHGRQRLYWVANSNREGLARPGISIGTQEAERQTEWWRALTEALSGNSLGCWLGQSATQPKPMLRSGDDGLFARVGRLRGYGNAIVPQVAQAFIESYLEAVSA